MKDCKSKVYTDFFNHGRMNKRKQKKDKGKRLNQLDKYQMTQKRLTIMTKLRWAKRPAKIQFVQLNNTAWPGPILPK